MADRIIPVFGGELRDLDGTDISLDNSVLVLEKEWAVTSPKLDRPVLLTHGVGYSEQACTGFYLYDPRNRVAGLGHVLLTENDRFYERFQDVLREVTQAGAERLIFDYIGHEIVRASFDGVKKAEEQLTRDGMLIRPMQRIPLFGVALDTRDGSRNRVMSCEIGLQNRQRPYGLERFNVPGERGYIPWSRAYPVESPTDLRCPNGD